MRLNHVTVPARDLKPAVGFYDALGLELIVLTERYARFAVDDVSTLSVEVGQGSVGDVEIFLCCADVDTDYRRASDRGLAFDWEPTDQFYLWRTAGLRDPAGNRIILFTAGANQHDPPWRLKPN
jgi:catechol 2,3-dioxygenase-like lactoylglutathione lyase family enzyme